jgi:predicted glutamine amidotransferase
MCRLLGYLSIEPLSLRNAVGTDFNEFLNLAARHGDGWGLAQLDRGAARPRVRRMPESALDSSELGTLADSVESDGATFHLRWATPGLTIRTQNTHPFVADKYIFMHNGAISPAIDTLVPSGLRPRLQGDTDSEKYFFVALECIDRDGPLSGMIEAVRKISGACGYTSLNALLLTPDELIIVSQYRPECIAAGEPGEYYEIRYRVGEGRFVVASTGWPQEGWTSLPNHSVSRIERTTLAISIHSLIS